MSKSRFSVHRLTLVAVIAAAYAGLTLLLPILLDFICKEKGH